MMIKTNKTQTVVSVSSQIKAFKKAEAKLARKATRAATKAALKLAKNDSNFTHVAELNPGHTLRRGAGTGWCAKVTLVGRRHRCVLCNKIVPVEQESSNFCSPKHERLHQTQLALTAMGFGRQSR